MGGLITRAIQALINGIGGLGSRFIGLLPQSPFQNLDQIIPQNPVVDFVLWILPISQALTLLSAWLAAIVIYYAVKVPLRWAKVIKS